MLKSFRLLPLCVAIVLAPKAALSAQPVTDLLCYAITSRQTLNLSKLCQQTEPSTDSIRPVENRPTAKVAISESQYASGRLSGQVTNPTNSPVQNVKVNYEVLDNQGTVIDSGFISVQSGTIAPGRSAAFSGETIAGSQVRVTFAEWSQ
jgi:hypothetical protein